MSEWISVEDQPLPREDRFLCVINSAAGLWVGLGIYKRHYDAGPENRCPGKYEFFYVTHDPEEGGLRFKKELEEIDRMITDWMPLPIPPGLNESN